MEHLLNSLNEDQRDILGLLQTKTRHQFRVPTGVGKGYVMIVHILHSVLFSEEKTFAIASHRLSLNNQHLRDIIEHCIKMNLIGKVKFLTIGSAALNTSKVLGEDLNLNMQFNRSLYDYNKDLPMSDRITIDSIFKSTLSKDEVNSILQKNSEDGFKTIIVTTYNSLDKLKDFELDVIYLDEAHILATANEEADFKKSYELIQSKKRFFFTATPKDVEEQMIKDGESSSIFLMNNLEIFGEIYSVPFIKCVQSGYITKPVIHVARPSDLDGQGYLTSLDNQAKFITETFSAHEKWLKSVSAKPDEIEPKILVRCESVSNMWSLYQKLIDSLPDDIILCAGASYNNTGGANHVIGRVEERNRDQFLKKLQMIEDNRKVIILNFDIFSEGLNLPGVTGVVFLQGKLPTIAKVIQNVGRATRLNKVDRQLLRSGDIDPYDYTKWIKPFCAVIIPYWDDKSEETKNILADVIRNLRDSWEFDPHFVVSVGDDMADGDPKNEIEGLNNLKKNNKRTQIIEEINNEIEKLDNLSKEQMHSNFINSMDFEEWFKFANDL